MYKNGFTDHINTMQKFVQGNAQIFLLQKATPAVSKQWIPWASGNWMLVRGNKAKTVQVQ